ncbi:MarR family winged helix-turn-helix transcriptional regulator [Paracoccus alkanivorans]|uniref:MarR family transcriptional regulator n=1 Tax=Paracoccus alkanivorans TaxID=2116655 RepID=A0A3M0M4I7_9RHOB|nr:MarR family transcriptional regulator [Paracoccus alkanivorans]RMC31344.1 MarR family transcriptional regulator [Paracoccus alkanivorans]
MPTDTAIIDSLLQVMRILRRHYDDCARDMGLTMSRARVISELTRKEGVTQTELASALDIEAPTLKRQIDALEAGGFVSRRPIEGDARKNAIFLTEQGRASQITAFTRKLRSDVLEGIAPEDLTRARDVLDRIAENIVKLGRK